MNRVTLVLLGITAFATSFGNVDSARAANGVFQMPCIGAGNGGKCQIGLYPCDTLISEAEKYAKDRIKWKVDGWYEGKERHPMGFDPPKETRAVMPICSVVATEFNGNVVENQTGHTGASCGKKVDIDITMGWGVDVDIHRDGDDGRWEDGQLRGAKISAYACSVAQVTNEARQGKIQLSPECRDLGEKLEKLGARTKVLSDQLAGQTSEMACKTLNQGKFETCKESGDAATGAPIQSACQVAAAGVDIQAAMNQLMACETFARADRNYDLAFLSAAGRARIDSWIDQNVAKACDGAARSGCGYTGCDDGPGQNCYNSKIVPEFQRIIEYFFPANGDCKTSSILGDSPRESVNASAASLLLFVVGFVKRRRKSLGTLARVVSATALAVQAGAFATVTGGCASATVHEPKCVNRDGSALFDEDTGKTFDGSPAFSFPHEVAKACCGFTNYNAQRLDCPRPVDSSWKSCYILDNVDLPSTCPWKVPDDVESSGGFPGSTGVVGGDAVGNGNTALDVAESLLSGNSPVSPNQFNPKTFAATSGEAGKDTDPAGRRGDEKRDPAGRSGDGSNLGGGSGGGGLSSGGGGSLSGVSTDPASQVALNPGDQSAATGVEGTGYSGGGGGANVARSGGDGNLFGDLFGGGANGAGQGGSGSTVGFGEKGAVSAMGGADPEDYFARLGVDENLFKVVERKYKQAESKGAIGL